ncbi:hypothetical protein QTP88_023075 [Uroleucon formosanum]
MCKGQRIYTAVHNKPDSNSYASRGKHGGDSQRYIFHRALPIPNESFDSIEFIALYVHIFQQLTLISSTSSISQSEVMSSVAGLLHATFAGDLVELVFGYNCLTVVNCHVNTDVSIVLLQHSTK